MGLDTVDIEELVSTFGADMVSRLTDLSVAALLAEAPWLAFAKPVLSELISAAISYLFHEGGLLAFAFNSNLITTDQWRDYADDVEVLNQLPDNVPDEVWDAAEDNKNKSFANLVNYRR